MEYIYTPKGREKVNHFIRECEAKRKEILDAGIDTADEVDLPSAQDILNCIEDEAFFDNWGVTDHYCSNSLGLIAGEDFILVDNGDSDYV